MEVKTLTGQLLDKKTGNPIPEAQVLQNSSETEGATTNEDGDFLLNIDENAKKSITFKAENYKAQNFGFHSNGKPQVFYLEPLEPKLGKTIPADTKKETAKSFKDFLEKHGTEAVRPAKKKEKDWEQIIMIGLLLVLLGTLGYFAYKMFKKKNPTPPVGNPFLKTETPTIAAPVKNAATPPITSPRIIHI